MIPNMSTADSDKARSRFIRATGRFIDGARMQRDRVLSAAADAPRLLPGTEYEVANLTDAPSNDLDYYAYELARMQDAAQEVIKRFDRPPEIVQALEIFNLAIPRLRSARNPLTHPSDDDRLDDMAWFNAVVNLKADGSVEYLVDPRYGHHDAVLSTCRKPPVLSASWPTVAGPRLMVPRRLRRSSRSAAHPCGLRRRGRVGERVLRQSGLGRVGEVVRSALRRRVGRVRQRRW